MVILIYMTSTQNTRSKYYAIISSVANADDSTTVTCQKHGATITIPAGIRTTPIVNMTGIRKWCAGCAAI